MIITGAIAMSKLSVANCTLQVLNVNSNNIGDDGISVIIEQLQHITTLTKLYVAKCGLSVKGTLMCVRCTYRTAQNFDGEILMNLMKFQSS